MFTFEMENPKIDLNLFSNKESSSNYTRNQQKLAFMEIKSRFSKSYFDYFISKSYQLIELIGYGSFGIVFRAQNIENKGLFAIKIEFKTSGKEDILLTTELEILKSFQETDLFPKLYGFGETPDFSYIIMEYLGDSIETLRKLLINEFENESIFYFAKQAINLLSIYHSKGYVHRDIKPENFVIGFFNNEKKVYLIDYGLSEKYVNSDSKHRKLKHTNSYVGTARYASFNAHKGYDQSRQDDLISLGYLLIHLATGTLPWKNLDIIDQMKKWVKIGKIKAEFSVNDLCKDLHPAYGLFLNYVLKLNYDEKPDYSFLIKIFGNIKEEPCWIKYCKNKYDEIHHKYSIKNKHKNSTEILEKRFKKCLSNYEEKNPEINFIKQEEASLKIPKSIQDIYIDKIKKTNDEGKIQLEKEHLKNWNVLEKSILDYEFDHESSDIPFEYISLAYESPANKVCEHNTTPKNKKMN